MSAVTGIEWTDRTWNPVTGCDKVSPGCAHCYAEGVAERFWAKQYPPVVQLVATDKIGERVLNAYLSRPRRFADVMTHDDRLLEPLSWRKPARVFVNSMSDLFHEDVPDAFIDKVFAVMAYAGRHTFQVLTKRPERMRAYFNDIALREELIGCESERLHGVARHNDSGDGPRYKLPFPNVWLGVSVENQHFADERIPLLLQTPSAVRFISAEPLLGPVSLRWLPAWPDSGRGACLKPEGTTDHLDGLRGLNWVIVGGESGRGARPFDLAWARVIVQQCREAGVACFVKQLGAQPFQFINPVDRVGVALKDRKGGDPSEWPEPLPREFPEVRA